MSPTQLLFLLDINRESLISNSRAAIDDLQHIMRDFMVGNENHEACLLSVALNQSLVEMLFNANYQRAIDSSRAVLQKIPDSEHYFLTGNHHRVIGRCLTITGKFEEAKNILDRAMQLAENRNNEQHKATQLKGDVLYDRAMLSCYSGEDHENCIALLEQAIGVLTGEEFKVRRAVCYVGLGNVHGVSENFEQALTYFHKAADIFEDELVLNSLGCAYSNIGMCHIELKQYAEAKHWLDRAYDLLVKAGSPGEIGGLHYNFAMLNMAEAMTDEALSNLHCCRAYAEESGDKPLLRKVTSALAEITADKPL